MFTHAESFQVFNGDFVSSKVEKGILKRASMAVTEMCQKICGALRTKADSLAYMRGSAIRAAEVSNMKSRFVVAWASNATLSGMPPEHSGPPQQNVEDLTERKLRTHDRINLSLLSHFGFFGL